MFPSKPKKTIADPALKALVEEFLIYAKVEDGFSQESLLKYEECIRRVEFLLGRFDPQEFTKADLLKLKSILMSQVGVMPKGKFS